MKILILSRGVPSVQDPTNGNFEYEQALALKKAGHEVILAFIDRRTRVSYKRKNGLFNFSNSPIKVYGGYLFPLSFRLFPWLSTALYNKRFLQLFRMIVENEGLPDIVHCHYLFNLPCAVAIKRHYNIPVVETEHWSDIRKIKLPHYVNYFSSYYKSADCIIAVSKSIQSTLIDRFGVESCVIHNMVSEEYFTNDLHSTLTKGSTLGKSMRFIAVGTLLKVKAHDLLIKSFYLYHLQYPEATLMIVGDGPERGHLEDLIKALHLEDNVTLTGRLGKLDVKSRIMNSDIMIISSYIETFSVVAIEAMACGLPVISTDCGGPSDFITLENGVICKHRDAESISKEMIRMTNNYSNYDKGVIANYVKEHFHPVIVASKMINVYKHVILSHGSDL